MPCKPANVRGKRPGAAGARSACNKQFVDFHARIVHDVCMNALRHAIALVGSQAKLARAVGVTPMAISQWKKRQVPPEHCLQITRITNGAIRCEDLRPDLDWAAIRCPEKVSLSSS